jgi:hypothetical protein
VGILEASANGLEIDGVEVAHTNYLSTNPD